MAKYLLKTVSEDLFKKFSENSYQSTVFTSPNFINLFDYRVKYWMFYKGDEEVCGWPICLKKETDEHYYPDFFYYFGPVWSKKFFLSPEHSWLSLSTNVYSEYIDKFSNLYKNYNFQLHPSLKDVRIFSWHNYGTAKKKFTISPKYTAIIKDLDKKNENDIKANFRYWRRNEINKVSKNSNFCISEEYKPKEIIDLYLGVHHKQNKIVSKSGLKDLEIIVKRSTKENYIKILTLRDKNIKEPVSMTINILEKNKINLLANATDIKFKNLGCNAFLIHKTIMMSKNLGVKSFDFNGANSPQRADDKHSFGSSPDLFFDISI